MVRYKIVDVTLQYSFETGLMVCLKPPHTLTLDLLAFKTGTIGEAHSGNWTGSSVPSATSLSNSLSTRSFRA